MTRADARRIIQNKYRCIQRIVEEHGVALLETWNENFGV